MTERKPVSPADAFLKRSAAFARRLGAPEGTYAAVISAGGVEVPVVGSVGDAGGPLKASKAERLRRARAELKALEDRGFRKW